MALLPAETQRDGEFARCCGSGLPIAVMEPARSLPHWSMDTTHEKRKLDE